MELHSGDMANPCHRETCRKILAHLFGQAMNELEGDQENATSFAEQYRESAATRTISKSKVWSFVILSAWCILDDDKLYTRVSVNFFVLFILYRKIWPTTVQKRGSDKIFFKKLKKGRLCERRHED